MARINVDDDFWVDPRLRHLSRKLDSETRAVGMCLLFWRIAQRYWTDEHKLVPKDLFMIEGLEPLVEVGLAEIRGDGVYAKGAERFDWLKKKRDAGRKRASAPRNQDGTFTTSTPANIQQTSSGAGQNIQPLALAPALALVPSPLTPPPAVLESGSATPTVAEEDKVSPREIAELWNELSSPKQPKVRLDALKPSQNRWASIRARLVDFPDIVDWRAAIARLAASEFCNGSNDRGWIADFDFLVTRKDTIAKALEGKYDNKKKVSGSQVCGVDYNPFLDPDL